MAAWQTASLESLDLVGLLIDGVHIGEHCLIVALGIAADGQKHALGLWNGSTENARVCQDLLANLQSRGLRTDRSLLVILDGSKALKRGEHKPLTPSQHRWLDEAVKRLIKRQGEYASGSAQPLDKLTMKHLPDIRDT